jgi:hypothetical protein
MNRDNVSVLEADELIELLKQQVREGENPEDVLFEEGFEPDYIFDII